MQPYTRSFIQKWIADRQTVNSTYFMDNIRKIDAILVFKMSDFSLLTEKFLRNLKKIGIELEFAPSTNDIDLIFCKVHAPTPVLIKYADRYNIPLKKNQTIHFSQPDVPCGFLENLLNSPRPDPDDPIAKRAWESISKSQPTDITNCERIVIVFAIMDYVSFGFNDFDVGLKQLLHKKVFKAAFPLHDGAWEWPEDPKAPINDRQLLARYWANCTQLYKQQPLNIVEKYFGYEIATYFAWLGFYNKMLVYASFMGLVTSIFSFYFAFEYDRERINLYCNRKKELCAEHNTWQRMKFGDACVWAYLTFFNANLGTCIFSCCMIIWCTVFKELWKRKLNVLNAKWEKTESEDFLLRPQFIANSKLVRRHKYTKEPELCISICEKILRFCLSISGTIGMIGFLIASLIAIICFESFLKSLHLSRFVVTSIICVFSALFMTFLEKQLFDHVAAALTKIELPRTELEYEKSYHMKSSIYAFINNTGRLMYIAFLKGRFDIPNEDLAQMCILPGCFFEVAFMMHTILLFKPFFDNFTEVFRPFFFIIFRKIWRRTINLTNKPRWEREYVSNSLGSILGELEEMVIQYGIVACFAAVCPLGPCFALFHNCVEIKVDSIKVLRFYARPVEKKQISSIGLWFDIFESMTYVIIMINAFFIAYTCNVVYLIYYFLEYEEEKKSYFSFNYSPFNDCYVPHADSKRLITQRKAFEAGTALTIIILGFMVSGIISYFIPDVPRSLREYLHHHETRKDK